MRPSLSGSSRATGQGIRNWSSPKLPGQQGSAHQGSRVSVSPLRVQVSFSQRRTPSGPVATAAEPNSNRDRDRDRDWRRDILESAISPTKSNRTNVEKFISYYSSAPYFQRLVHGWQEEFNRRRQMCEGICLKVLINVARRRTRPEWVEGLPGGWKQRVAGYLDGCWSRGEHDSWQTLSGLPAFVKGHLDAAANKGHGKGEGRDGTGNTNKNVRGRQEKSSQEDRTEGRTSGRRRRDSSPSRPQKRDGLGGGRGDGGDGGDGITDSQQGGEGDGEQPDYRIRPIRKIDTRNRSKKSDPDKKNNDDDDDDDEKGQDKEENKKADKNLGDKLYNYLCVPAAEKAGGGRDQPDYYNPPHVKAAARRRREDRDE